MRQLYMRNLLILSVILLNITVVAQDGLVETRYPSGRIQSRIFYIKDVIDGTAKWYHENGVIKEEANYTMGKLHGWKRSFYDNGAPREEIPVNEGKKDGIVKEYYDNGGLKTFMVYEEGVLKEKREYKYDSTLKPPDILAFRRQNANKTNLFTEKETSVNTEINKEEEFKRNIVKELDERSNSSSVSDLAIPADDASYLTTVDVKPEPIGGFGLIQKKAIYPSSAKPARVKGEVIVLAYINENGKVTRTNVEKGLGSGCDEAAMKAVSTTLFRPGKVGKEYVKVLLKIPIIFNLKN